MGNGVFIHLLFHPRLCVILHFKAGEGRLAIGDWRLCKEG